MERVEAGCAPQKWKIEVTRNGSLRSVVVCLALVGVGLVLGCSDEKAATSASQPLTSSPCVAFGPLRFTRTKGPPNEFEVTFPRENLLGGPFKLRIENGNLATGTNRVSSATVTVNGAEIASPNDFNQQVAVIEEPVSLTASNTLTGPLDLDARVLPDDQCRGRGFDPTAGHDHVPG